MSSSPPFVRDDVAAFLALVNAPGQPVLSDFPAAEARELSAARRDITEAPLGDMRRIEDFACPGRAGDIPLRLFDDRSADELNARAAPIIFYHGGGFVIGSVDSHASLCAHIARTCRRAVISVDYRLAPEHPFPAAPDDALAAARWIASNDEALGLDFDAFSLMGDSAGANLAYVTAAALRDAPAAKPVNALGLIYPVSGHCGTDGSFREFREGYLLTRGLIDWFDGHYRPDEDDPRRSFATAGFEGMPPTAIITASLDPLLDHGRALAGDLARAGVDCSYLEARGNIHGFATLRRIVPSSQKDIDDFLDSFAMMEARAL